MPVSEGSYSGFSPARLRVQSLRSAHRTVPESHSHPATVPCGSALRADPQADCPSHTVRLRPVKPATFCAIASNSAGGNLSPSEERRHVGSARANFLACSTNSAIEPVCFTLLCCHAIAANEGKYPIASHVIARSPLTVVQDRREQRHSVELQCHHLVQCGDQSSRARVVPYDSPNKNFGEFQR